MTLSEQFDAIAREVAWLRENVIVPFARRIVETVPILRPRPPAKPQPKPQPKGKP